MRIDFLRSKWFFALLFTALMTAGVLLLFWISNSKNPLAAIPSETSIVLDYNHLNLDDLYLLEHASGDALRELLQQSDLENIRLDAQQAQQLMAHHSPLRAAFEHPRMLVALTLKSSDKGHALFVLDLKKKHADLNEAMEILRSKKQLDSVASSFLQDIHVAPHQFRGTTLWRLSKPACCQFVFAQQGDLLLYSQSAGLVEDALANLESSENWWTQCPYFRETSAQIPLRVVLRPSTIAQRWSQAMLPPLKELPLLLVQQFGWIGLSWDGQTLSMEAAPQGIFRQFAAWGAAPRDGLFTVLPSNTAAVLQANFSKASSFLHQSGMAPSRDLREYIEPWWGCHLTFALTEPLSADWINDQFILLEALDTAGAGAYLEKYGQQHGLLKKYDHQTFPIWQFAEGSLLWPFTQGSAPFQNPACTILGDYVVFAASPTALEPFIDRYVVNETLSAAPDFLAMAQKLPAERNALLLFNGSSLLPLSKSFCQPAWVQSNTQTIVALAALGWMGTALQAGATGGRVSFQPALAGTGQPISPTATGLIWKTPLAAEAATPPSVVYAPPEQGGSTILIQDLRHQLYCLGSGGRLRWRRQLPAHIRSNVQGVQFDQNATRCYLFNTPDAIWLLDENGHDVAGFPLQLRSPATNGVVAVTFGDEHDPCYFIALENGNVLGFDRFGRPLVGWNPQPVGPGSVTTPVLHFQYAEKDYLAVLSQTGRLSVFGKNGSARFAPIQWDGQFSSPLQVNLLPESPRIVCFNHQGKAFECDLQGNISSHQVGPIEKPGIYSAFLPVRDHHHFKYAVLSENTISGGQWQAGKYQTLFSKKIDSQWDTLCMTQNGSVALLNRSKGLLMLLDEQGEMLNGRIVSGTTTLASAPESTGIIVVGNKASICAYRF